MKHLRKPWVRAIVSLFGGGLVAELIHISTGDPNRPMTTNLSLVYAIAIYVTLTLLVKNRSNKIY